MNSILTKSQCLTDRPALTVTAMGIRKILTIVDRLKDAEFDEQEDTAGSSMRIWRNTQSPNSLQALRVQTLTMRPQCQLGGEEMKAAAGRDLGRMVTKHGYMEMALGEDKLKVSTTCVVRQMGLYIFST